MARVLALSALHPPHHLGGYELSCRDVLAQWERNGHETFVLTSDVRMPGVATPPGEAVARTLRLYWRDGALWSPPRFTRMRIEAHNQRMLAETLDRFRPDVVSVWHMAGMSFGLLTSVLERGLPMVCVTCDEWLDFGPRYDAWTRVFRDRPRLGRAVRALTGLPTRLPDLGAAATFCFVSETIRRHAEEHTPWSYPRSTVVWSGIDTAVFTTPDPLPDKPWQWRLLFVGRLAHAKGVDTAIRVLPLLPPVTRLTIAGRGEAAVAAELHALADRLGVADRIEWVDADRDEVRTLYLDADALVFPTRWREPFGLVPVEAMASGTPVVATGAGGSSEFCIDEVNCLRFPADDVDALAACLSRLAGDAELRATLRQGGVTTARELTNDRLAAALEAWHLATIERFASGVPPHRRLALTPT